MQPKDKRLSEPRALGTAAGEWVSRTHSPAAVDVRTFFKVSYRRHTNFAMESIQQTFNGVADFSRTVMCTLSRNGDLLGRTYLYVSVPSVAVATGDKFRWTNWLGHAMLKMIDFEIGGQRIDRQYGDWLQIWMELTLESGKKSGYAALVGNNAALTQLYVGPATVPSTTMHIPLQFFFNRNIGQSLPLIALQYHECKITIYFRDVRECCYLKSTTSTTKYPQLSSTGGDAQLWCDYVFLDTDERRRFAQISHEYLIEQLQFTGDESISAGTGTQKVKLSFNHPVKELVWVVQKDDIVDYTNTAVMDAIGGPQFWNYTTKADNTGYAGFAVNAFSTGLFSGSPLATNLMFGSALAQSSASNTTDSNNTFTWYAASNSNAFTTFGGAGTAGTPLLDLGVNPVVTAKLVLNGSDRFAERNGQYFNLVQSYQHHTNIPAIGINLYSFAISPEQQQPSGSANFSRIDQAILNITLDSTIFLTTAPGTASNTSAKLRIYAVNYNVLRVMSGMGGLAYSN